jgi:hypothetical protein
MLILPIYVENITTRKDRSVKITLSTQEMTPAQVADIWSVQSQMGYMALKEETFQGDELAALNGLKADADTGGKSYSKRVQSVLYVLFKQDSEGFTSFELYYQHKMEKMLTHYKSKIIEPTYR